ncbi:MULTISPECIES: flagellar biosynthesis anti-sigma factor FlgM [unclassified Pseudomonas]|uniref:flagellar biosynthesis anti-sigma factor FlgM n=1 Tax=unclassified Pseudomonas TaxID=196821 RepID=UPI002E80E345|nr:MULTISPECIES: flagellar biosynthesis anti-sigma factor FlgM [unclassified Pseudomonas]
MEITRPFKPAVATQSEAAVVASGTVAQKKTVNAARSESLPLEQLQDALGSLPEIDMAKVEQIKAALQLGEISLDLGALARSMLAYHRGSDA